MHLIIYLVALLEWFTTLSVEITALRIFSPIIWVNSISTSIILWVILLALSYGYYIWWKISARNQNIEKYLLRNLLFSSVYYFFITFIFAEFALQSFLLLIPSYFLALLITSILLFFIPVFLASQTIPLLSEMLKWKHSWEKIWKLLFYSTIWSFLWSVWTSVVLFPWLGVEKTAIISPLLLVICGLLLVVYMKSKIQKYLMSFIILIIFYTAILVSNIPNPENVIYKTSNVYHTINIYNNSENQRIFSMDRAYSSWINIETWKSFFNYIKEIKQQIIQSKSENILIIWAAGFTLPNELSEINSIKNIDVIDIDKDLKEISEKYFLQKELSDKINFYPESARFYLNNLWDKKYDAVVVDAYSGQSLPPQLLTLEYFKQLSDISDNIYLNIIIDKNLYSNFSVKLFETVSQWFDWNIYYKNVNNTPDYHLTNIVILNKSNTEYWEYIQKNTEIYTDNINSIEWDLFELNNLRIKK